MNEEEFTDECVKLDRELEKLFDSKSVLVVEACCALFVTRCCAEHQKPEEALDEAYMHMKKYLPKFVKMVKE